jgi:AcrR family transcriptional regulator
MSEVNSQKRQNKSTLRQRQAQATADMIVAAAKALFMEQGYGTTTIEAIANRSGVAVSTVYAVFGSKRGILRAMRAAWHERSRIRDVAYRDLGDMGSEERLQRLAQGTRQQWETGSEVTTIYNQAAAVDAEAFAELKLALAGRRKGMENFASGMAPYLLPGLDIARAADIIEALCLAEVYYQLVRRSGWSAEAYEEWLFQILKHQLLAQSGS